MSNASTLKNLTPNSLSENEYWQRIAENIITDPNNPERVYADWTASGRLYAPIEQRISEIAGGFMANTHTEDSFTGRTMTRWLHQAEGMIKKHVNASKSDVLLNVGSGMTSALAKLIRMMGWWCHEQHREAVLATLAHRPLVYITHREHHSNHTMWLESLAEVRIIPALENDEIDLAWLEADLAKQADRPVKLASITAASNVTGIQSPYLKIAKIMHNVGGWCFVDFAASAPYVEIDMHPSETDYLDAIFFSPHKFLGGPGTSGVLVFNQSLYSNRVPEQPGGGTVVWTNPWGEHQFVTDIEQRESGGTPGILQTIKTALAIQLKEEMGVARILAREHYLNGLLFERLEKIQNVRVLSGQHKDRLSIFSILFSNVDYKTAVNLLSDVHQIETRGGCACAGTYGHYLLDIDYCASHAITDQLTETGDHQLKPGWVRLSLHPSMNEHDIERIVNAIELVANSEVTVNKPIPQEIPDLWGALS